MKKVILCLSLMLFIGGAYAHQHHPNSIRTTNIYYISPSRRFVTPSMMPYRFHYNRKYNNFNIIYNNRGYRNPYYYSPNHIGFGFNFSI